LAWVGIWRCLAGACQPRAGRGAPVRQRQHSVQWRKIARGVTEIDPGKVSLRAKGAQEAGLGNAAANVMGVHLQQVVCFNTDRPLWRCAIRLDRSDPSGQESSHGQGGAVPVQLGHEILNESVHDCLLSENRWQGKNGKSFVGCRSSQAAGIALGIVPAADFWSRRGHLSIEPGDYPYAQGRCHNFGYVASNDAVKAAPLQRSGLRSQIRSSPHLLRPPILASQLNGAGRARAW
jgi:hypothetical protein